MEEVAGAPVEELALLASGTDWSLLLLLLVGESARVSVTSSLLVVMALLNNFLEAIKTLATVLYSLVFSDFLKGFKPNFTHVASIVQIISCILFPGPLRVPNRGIYRLV